MRRGYWKWGFWQVPSHGAVRHGLVWVKTLHQDRERREERKAQHLWEKAPNIIDIRRRAITRATETHRPFSAPLILVQSFHPHQSASHSPARQNLPETSLPITPPCSPARRNLPETPLPITPPYSPAQQNLLESPHAPSPWRSPPLRQPLPAHMSSNILAPRP